MGTGESELHPYWHGGEIIWQALAMNKQAAAATAFHRAVSLMPAAIAEAEADYDSIPEDIRAQHISDMADYEEDIPQQDLYPFTGQNAFAFAATRGDQGSLEILDSICGSFSEEPEPCSVNYLRIVQTIQNMVAANDVTDIKDVRKKFSPIDRVRLRSVWREMRVAKILIVETQGQKVFFHRSAPAPGSSGPQPILFRKGMPPFGAVLLERPEHLKGRSWGHPTHIQSLDDWPLAVSEEVLVPKESRRTRKSQTASAGNKNWLQGVTINRRADGSRYTTAAVINPDGSPGPTFDLPDGWVRSNPQGDCGISVGRDWDVRIYTSDAEQVLALSLSATPEVTATIRSFGDKYLEAKAAIRSVHASQTAERLVVSVINKVFVYSFDGDVIAAFQLDDAITSHLGIKSSRPDWAYFVQLAADGRGLYIGAHSGLLLHVSFGGELMDSWVLPSAPRVLRETEEGISGSSDSFLFRASRGSEDAHCLFIPFSASQLVGSKVILDTRTTSRFFDLEDFVGWNVELPKPRTAVYIANGDLVMETATSRLTF